jgi:uncharacterized protein (DUF1778 family)
MASVANNKVDRLDLRLPAELKRLIERAAALSGQSISDFVLGSVTPRARKVVRESTSIQLSDRDRDTFLAALERTEPRPLPGLMRAMERHDRVIG